MRNPARGFTLVAAAFAFTGCDAVTTTPGAVEVRDSAGIRIVENVAESADTSWTVAAEPTLSIGTGVAEMQALDQVSGATRLRDGRIVIAQRTPPMLRGYDTTGSYIGGTGRPGGGPGEFGGADRAWIAALWRLPGDSIATWEHAQRRMQVFDPAFEYARSITLELPPNLRPGEYVQIVGRQRAGFIGSLLTPWEPGPIGGVQRPPLTYVRYDAEGRYAGELARLPGYTRFTGEFRSPDGRVSPIEQRQPFGANPAIAVSETRFFYGSGETYEIMVHDSAGALEMLIRRPAERDPMTDAAIEANRAEVLSDAPSDPAGRRAWEENVNSAPYPDHFPAYRRFVADHNESVWVQDYAKPGETAVPWRVFDRSGAWVASVRLPVAWEILEIGDTYLLVLERDEMDVQRVSVYALGRR